MTPPRPEGTQAKRLELLILSNFREGALRADPWMSEEGQMPGWSSVSAFGVEDNEDSFPSVGEIRNLASPSAVGRSCACQGGEATLKGIAGRQETHRRLAGRSKLWPDWQSLSSPLAPPAGQVLHGALWQKSMVCRVPVPGFQTTGSREALRLRVVD